MTGCGTSGNGVDPKAFQNPSDEYGILKIAHSLNKMYGEDVLDKFVETTLRGKGYSGVVTNYPFGGAYLTGDRGWEVLRDQLGWLSEEGMRYWIYDESGYPSGGAGGLTLKDHPEYEALGLARVTAVSDADGHVSIPLPATHEVPFAAYAYPGGSDAEKDTAGRVEITDAIDPQTGALDWTSPEGGVWFAETFGLKPLYDDTHAEGNASADRRYINIIDREAVGHFIDVTYERYYEQLGDEVFSKIEAFFTDEPSIISMYLADFGSNVPVIDQPNPDFVRWPTLAWSRDFFDEFESRKGYDLHTVLSELFCGTDEAASRARYDYWSVLADLISENYYGQIGDWCAAHGVGFSGHQLAEEALNQQVICEGNFFRNYSHMTMPGIDMLSASPEQVMRQAMTPKMAASASRLYADGQVMSESSEYSLKDANGNLTISIDEVRCSLALQYALGVTQLTSYFSYNDLSPKDEEPQDITGTMVKRLGQTIVGNRHVADTALFYPAETLYAELIPTTDNWHEPRSPRAGTTTDSYQGAFYALLNAQLDLDILPADALADAETGEGFFTTSGGNDFRVLVIPTLSMLETATIERLTALADAGVKLVFLPQSELTTPNGEDTEKALTLWQALQSHKNAVCADGSGALAGAVREALGTPDLAVESSEGVSFAEMTGTSVAYGHWETETSDIYLLVRPASGSFTADFSFRASGKANRLDPLTGEIEPLRDAKTDENGVTTIPLTLEGYDYFFVEFVR